MERYTDCYNPRPQGEGEGGSEVLNYVKGEKGSPLKEEGIPLPRERPAPLFPLSRPPFFWAGEKVGHDRSYLWAVEAEEEEEDRSAWAFLGRGGKYCRRTSLLPATIEHFLSLFVV